MKHAPRTNSYRQQYIRIIFRFLFTVPLLILGVDGVTSALKVNMSMCVFSDIACMLY